MVSSFKSTLKVTARAAAFAVLAASPVFAQSTSSRGADDWSRIITAGELEGMVAQDAAIQIVDIRSEKYVRKGTIPSAIWVPFPEWRGPSERPGQPPTEEELEALLGNNGLNLDDPIIVHNHSGKTIQTGRAAIVYWILKSAGAKDIAILDGGFKAWNEAELPVSETPATPEPQVVDLTYTTDWWARPIDIYAVATQQIDGAILDARLDAQVKRSTETGKPMMSMPMAQFVPSSFFTNELAATNRTEESQRQFRADLEARGISLGTEFLISVCQTGELSALSWFYASEVVGIENVRYYPDALQGWQSDGGLLFGMHAGQ